MSRGLRILVIGSGWPAETVLEGLYRGLAERGVELWIASRHPLSGAPPGIRRLALPTVRGGRAGGSAHGIILGLGATLRRPAAVWRRLRDGGGALDDLPFLGRRFDLLYFPWNASAVRHLPLMRTGIPSLVSCRGAHIQVAPSNPERRALVAGLPETFTLAAAVHCVSHAMVDAARPLGLDPAKATV
ncbi:MAG: glycosyltransferase, partial [Holophagales bacterium]|nr:glycosyltransferase [Holophagales bacterium]